MNFRSIPPPPFRAMYACLLRKVILFLARFTDPWVVIPLSATKERYKKRSPYHRKTTSIVFYKLPETQQIEIRERLVKLRGLTKYRYVP